MVRSTATPLPFTSLPLHFTLLPSLSSTTFSSPLPCLVANLPYLASSLAPTVQDSRISQATVQVVRILDPEHREPFISLSRIFHACDVSPEEGLVRFELRKPAYDSSLGGLAPFIDIWVTLLEARKVAEELEVIDQLSALLEWETRSAWSVEDKEEGGGIVHNWKISSDRIDPSRYSTSAMLSTPFPRIHLLPVNSQVRTMTSPLPQVPESPLSFPSLWSKITEWTILEHEKFLDSQESREVRLNARRKLSPSTTSHNTTSPSPSRSTIPDLTLTSLYTSLFSLLLLTDSLDTSSLDQNTFSYVLGQRVKIERFEIGDPSNPKGKIALVDAVGRVVGREWRRAEEARCGIGIRGSERAEKLGGEDEDDAGSDKVREAAINRERWEKAIEDRLKMVEESIGEAVGSRVDPARLPRANGNEDSTEVDSLGWERIPESEIREKMIRELEAENEELYKELARARESNAEEAITRTRIKKTNVNGVLYCLLVGAVAVTLVPYWKEAMLCVWGAAGLGCGAA
ncbi:hypothetical protein P7C70_g4492, partial [Phenoliferia sp. Uapishka_3]